MKWATALAQAAHLEDAAGEAIETVLADLDHAPPDLLVAFVSPDYRSHVSQLAGYLADKAPDAVLVGCLGAGVIGGGHEVENQRALSLTGAVLPGVRLDAFHLDGDPAGWQESIGVAAEAAPAFLLFADPFTCRGDDLVRRLDAVYPESIKVGGLASGGYASGGTALLAGDRCVHGGAVGVAMSGNLAVDTVVAQGCRPIGMPLFVTRVEENLVLELDGQPATAIIEALYSELGPRDRELFRHSLHIGVVMDRTREEYRQGDFLIRNIAGVDPRSGGMLVAARVETHQIVQFHLRDARTAAAELAELFSRKAEDPPAGALLFSCLGRGIGLYGRPDHDSDAFRGHFGDVPLAGFFCNGELGPVGGRTFLHGYTSVFALFRPARFA